jgi:CheY-like chemotaxis protein
VLSADDSLANGLRLMAERWGADYLRLQSAANAVELNGRDVLLVDEDIDTTTTSAAIIRVAGSDPDALPIPLAYGELEKRLRASLRTTDRQTSVAGGAGRTSATQPLEDMQVLVAEDNSTNRLIIGKILSNWGANVRFAENGVEAKALYAESHQNIDLVIMDCEMPELDGYGATDAIRNLEADESIEPVPIIALTAHVMPEFRRRARAVGMSDYVTKPIDREVLLAAILNTTASRQTTDRRSR